MVTTVIKSIGTNGRDFSTLQAWEDAIPADLVAADQQWIGEAYNDNEFTAGMVITGHTTDATHNIILRTAAGQSFRDHATKSTNPLYYDQSKGVGVNVSAASAVVINCPQANFALRGFQIKATGTSGAAMAMTGDSNSVTVEYCILVGRGGCTFTGGGSKIRNCLFANDSSAGNGVVFATPGITCVNCTVVRPSNNPSSGRAFRPVYVNNILIRNCVAFGFAAFADTGASAACSNNCTDLASAPGTNNQLSKTYANQFVSTTAAGADFRLKSGSDCIDTGVTDTTNVPGGDDIIGTARSTWDIGGWEFVAGGGTTFSDTIGETITFSDAFVTNIAIQNTLLESVALAASVFSGNVFNETLTEPIALSATKAAAAVYANTMAEATALLDAFVAIGTLTESLSEAMSLADAYEAAGGKAIIWMIASPAGGTWTIVTPDIDGWSKAQSTSDSWTRH